MNLLIIFLFFFVTITYVQSAEGEETQLIQGDDFTVPLKADSFGLVRQVLGESKDEFFYFCAKAKGDQKKNCGAWIDEKGNKVAYAPNGVKLTKKGAVIAQMSMADSGKYASLPENKDVKKAAKERKAVYVTLILNG